jgi:hypothetical protein
MRNCQTGKIEHLLVVVNMTLNEAKDYLNQNGYELIDEGFFGSAYDKYKKTVLKLISKYGVELNNNLNEIEDWIRDYFLDKMNVYDCAKAIRDNI